MIAIIPLLRMRKVINALTAGKASVRTEAVLRQLKIFFLVLLLLFLNHGNPLVPESFISLQKTGVVCKGYISPLFHSSFHTQRGYRDDTTCINLFQLTSPHLSSIAFLFRINHPQAGSYPHPKLSKTLHHPMQICLWLPFECHPHTKKSGLSYLVTNALGVVIGRDKAKLLITLRTDRVRERR